MARRVACPHCTAPHRMVGGQTRYTCDYCRALVVAEPEGGLQELVVPDEPQPRSARRVAERWLRRKGVHAPKVVLQEFHYEPVWVISSVEGREHVILAHEKSSSLLRTAAIPAVSLVPRTDAHRGPNFRKPTVGQAEAQNAALATFGEDTIESVRLLWIPSIPLRARTPGGWVNGVYIGGADQVRFEPLPAGARDAPVTRSLLVAYSCLFGVALLAGLLIRDVSARAIVEGGLALTAAALWKPLMQSSGPRSTS